MKMLRALFLLCLLTLAAGAAFAQPSVALIVNAASSIRPGLPNAGIAEGAIFSIYGSNLGPPVGVPAASFPLKTDFQGTSVKVTVGSTTVSAILFFTRADQVNAGLPSTTPVGTGTLTVTYNGQTSPAVPIAVEKSNIGLFTVNSQGTGDGIVTLADYSLVTASHAANPGEIVILWTTGLGPVSYDETIAAAGGDQTSVPLEVFIGGKSANVLYRGRNTCCSSLDQINVKIPQDVSGCVVPLTLKIGNLVSNTVTMAVAASGRQCTPTNTAIPQSLYAQLLAKGSYSAGGVTLSRTTSISTTPAIPPLPATTTTTKTDGGGASFVKVSGNLSGLFNAQIDRTVYGSCVVTTFSGQASNPLSGLTLQSLDAGASIGVSGPNGNKTLVKQTAGGFTIYSATLGNATPGNYLDPGRYTITGPGGPDVGSFTAQLTLPQDLVWTNQASITTVNRASGVTLTWSGGDPAGYVTISGTSFVLLPGGNSAVGATFTCTAKTSDGSFTVPPVVLLALPASGSISAGPVSIPLPGALSLSGVSAFAPFQAPGVDLAAAYSLVTTTETVPYQ
jgi:uncharacterized protein (TIGR03437 family)